MDPAALIAIIAYQQGIIAKQQRIIERQNKRIADLEAIIERQNTRIADLEARVERLLLVRGRRAIEEAVSESRRYHASMLTGRCGYAC